MSQRAAGALAVENIDSRHGQLRAVKDFNMALARGDIVAIVGANGAGKSTLLRTIAGAHKAHGGRVWLNGREISHLRASQRVAAGISLVPEGRRLFPDMTVEENLKLGAISGRSGHWTMDRVFQSFPNLANRRRAKASTLSGGEQQATAIGRALMNNPDIVLLDEVSLGLSPVAVDLVYASLQALLKSGATIVLVEQDLSRAMKIARRLICMLEGEVVLDLPSSRVSREEVTAAYFGQRARGNGRQ